MPILIVEYRGTQQAGTLSGRVLIGRWKHNTVVVDDRTIARVHAWIGMEDGQYYLADTGSKTGVYVNGEPLHGRRNLSDGDHILIGPAVLRFLEGSELPTAFEEIDLSPRSPDELSDEKGIFRECACGAPLWFPRGFVGTGKCRYCGCLLRSERTSGNGSVAARPVPTGVAPLAPASEAFPPSARPASKVSAPAPMAPAAPPAEPAEQISGSRPDRIACCGVCHAAISALDEATQCPSCGLSFHADCWTENRGCSAFGCKEVGALDRNEPFDPALA